MMTFEWIIFIFVVVVLCVMPGCVWAAEEPQSELLWPEEAATAEPLHGQEELLVNHEHNRNESGFNRSHSFVSIPALSWHFPEGDVKTDVAVLVCPGGGYNEIWIDKEGHNIARHLTQQGLTAAVLKYRTRPQSMNWPAFMPAVLQDAARAMRLVRNRAEEFGFDARKVGMLGFSAGGHLTAALTVAHDEVEGKDSDEIDALIARPDFVALIYPGLFNIADNVGPDFPPTFIIHAKDDDIVPVKDSLQLYNALLGEKVQAELHIFSKGGHGFALGHESGGAVTKWPGLFGKWLGDIGMLKR